MLYLFYFQGIILTFFIIHYSFQFFRNTNDLKLFEGINLLFLISCLSPFIIIILSRIYQVDFVNNGIFAQYQKDFYIDIDQYLIILIKINSLIILASLLIFILYRFFYKKNIITTHVKLDINNIYFYIGLALNFIILCIYLYVSCYDNFLARTGSKTLPYLISSYIQNNNFVFNTFFIFKLPLLFLIFSFVFKFKNRKFNSILLITSLLLFLLINLRSASITPLLTIFFLFSLFLKYKYKIFIIFLFFLITLGLHHLKSRTNDFVVSPCLTSVQVSIKNIELVGRTFKGENIFVNERSVIKNINNQELYKLTYILKFLTRLEFISLSAHIVKEDFQANTYKHLIYKFIPRFFWQDKPIDNIASQFNKHIGINYGNISVIKLDVFTEGFYNFKYLGYFSILFLYLFIGIIVSYIYNKSKIKELQVIIVYCFSNYIWFDNNFTMLLGDSFYDLVISLLLLMPIYLFYKLKNNIYFHKYRG